MESTKKYEYSYIDAGLSVESKKKKKDTAWEIRVITLTHIMSPVTDGHGEKLNFNEPFPRFSSVFLTVSRRGRAVDRALCRLREQWGDKKGGIGEGETHVHGCIARDFPADIARN